MSSLEHEHTEEIEVDWGLTDDTKLAVEHVYVMGTKTAQTIIYALRNREILARLPETINKANIEIINNRNNKNYYNNNKN